MTEGFGPTVILDSTQFAYIGTGAREYNNLLLFTRTSDQHIIRARCS